MGNLAIILYAKFNMAKASVGASAIVVRTAVPATSKRCEESSF